MNEIRFTAPWSRLLIGMSIFATVLCLGVAAGLWHAAIPFQKGLPALAIWVPLALMVGAALFTVRGYSVTPDAILVHRLFWTTRLPRKGLVSAIADADAFSGALRTCGNGGFYSFSGWHWNKRLGRFRAWVTDPKRAVVLKYEHGTSVVSPGDPEGFIRAVESD